MYTNSTIVTGPAPGQDRSVESCEVLEPYFFRIELAMGRTAVTVTGLGVTTELTFAYSSST